MARTDLLQKKLDEKKEEINALQKQVNVFAFGTREDYWDEETGKEQKGTPVPSPFTTSSGSLVLTLSNLSSGEVDIYKKQYQAQLNQARTESENIQTELSIEKQKEELLQLQAQQMQFTYNYSSNFGTFSTQAATEQEAYSKFQEWLRQKESQITPEPTPQPTPQPQPTPEPPITAPLVTEPEPISIPEILPQVTAQPEINELITNDMIRQQVIDFKIVGNRIMGSIKFIATEKFNPFYYRKNLLNLTQFKTPNGTAIRVKENILRFTETERDEIINYNEDAQNNNRLTVESYVWESVQNPEAFSKLYSVQISEAEPPKPIDSGFMGAGAVGAIAGLILLGSLIDLRRKK